jgi:hypothetical protein
VYDNRKLVSKRAYLQCVLSLRELFAAGARPFQSNAPAAFYHLMLKSPDLAIEGLSAAECSARLNLTIGDAPRRMLALEVCAPARVDVPCILDVAGDSESEGQLEVAHVVAPVAPLAIIDAAVVGDVVGDSGSDGELDLIPVMISGQVVAREVHRNLDGSVQAEGIRVKCPNPCHNGHSKYRSLRLDQDLFGRRAAEFYLKAWIAEAHTLDERDHRVHRPTRGSVQAIFDEEVGPVHD